VALINAIAALDDVKMELDDENTGAAIFRKALDVPMRGIFENAGLDASVFLAEVRRHQEESGDLNVGYDIMTSQFGNMFDLGIMDPTKVTRSAVENAASIAAMILSTEALITDIPEPPAPAAPQGPGGGMDY